MRAALRVVQPVVRRFVDLIVALDPGEVAGAYLVGSSAAGGLRHDSDVDLLLVTRCSLDAEERRRLLKFCFQFSGSRATVEPGRPLEVTSLAQGDVVPWSYPPVRDFLYGEWLRDHLTDVPAPERHISPDVAVLLTAARQHAHVLLGPAVGDLLGAVPVSDLHRSLHDSLASLVDNLVGDERNVLLTLARMVVTLQSDQIVAKDEAVRRIAPSLSDQDRTVLERAAGGYRGDVIDDWSQGPDQTAQTAQRLTSRIKELGGCG